MAYLNKVMLIGNMTRDPELRYLQTGTAVCDFGIAVNRSFKTQGGEQKEQPLPIAEPGIETMHHHVRGFCQ